MTLSKKAIIQVSFGWIFMLFIGSFFIYLAFNIVSDFKDIEEQKFEIKLKNAIRTILNDAGRTSGIERDSLRNMGSIFEDSKVEIKCIEEFPVLSINDKYDSTNEYLRNYPTFMTIVEQGKTENTFMAVENFKLPFKITNLLAIVSKKNMILIDKNFNQLKNYLEKFEDNSYNGNLNYITYDFSVLDSNQANEYVKIYNLNSAVFVSGGGATSITIPPEIRDFIEHSKIYVSYVYIQNDDYDFGKIFIYDKSNLDGKEFIYIDYDKSLSLQTMAMFSTAETFECSYQTLVQHIPEKYNFYLNKTHYLIDIIQSGKQICSPSQTNENLIENFKNFEKELVDFLPKLSLGDTSEIYSKAKSIESELLKLDKLSCPFIY